MTIDKALFAEDMRRSLEICVRAALEDEDLMSEYRRLTGSVIGITNISPGEKMMDEACGNRAISCIEMQQFVHFVRVSVFEPMIEHWITYLKSPLEGRDDKS